MIRSLQGEGEVSQVHFPVIWTLQIWTYSSICLEFDLDLDIIFEKLTVQIGGGIWKTPSAHYVSGVEVFFFNMFSSGLYFNALIIRLF